MADKRHVARFWRTVQAKLARGELSRGAFAVLHGLANLAVRLGQGGVIDLPEREICSRLGIARDTWRKRRRELEAHNLLVFEIVERRGSMVRGKIILPFLLNGSLVEALTGPKTGPVTGPENSPVTGPKIGPVILNNITRSDTATEPFLKSTETISVWCNSPKEKDLYLENSHPGNDSAPSLRKKTENRTMGRLRKLLGDRAMDQWGGLWRKRIRQNHSAVIAAINEIELMIKEGRAPYSLGGYLNFLFRYFNHEDITEGNTKTDPRSGSAY